MKKTVKWILLGSIILLLSGCSKNYMTEINYSEYQKLIKNKETFVLEIMRTDCSACINFKPKLEAVVQEYKVEVKYINTDHLTDEENKELSKITGISGTPTVIFYQNGEEETISSRIYGSVSKEKIISKFKTNGVIQ